VTWLRKTPLLGNNLYEAVNKFPKEHIETQHVAKEVKALALAGGASKGRRTLAELVEAIEKSFEDVEALQPGNITHPTDPSLRAEEVLPVGPDFDCWPNEYVQMQFDVDPGLEREGESKISRQRVSQALVKGYKGSREQGEQPHFAYLLPKEDGEAGEELALDWVREYAYDVKREAEDAAFFFAVLPDRVVYNEVSSKISLTRKTFRDVGARPSAVTVRRRALDEAEEAEHVSRRRKIATEQLRITHQPLAEMTDE